MGKVKKILDSVYFVCYKIFSTFYIHCYWVVSKWRCYYYRFCKKRTLEKNFALMLAWSLPPSLNGGVYRPMSFLKYSEQFGWQMETLTGPMPEPDANRDAVAQDLLSSIPKSAKINRIKKLKITPIAFLTPSIDGGFYNMPYLISLGLKKFSKKRPAVIIATGPPFHSFIAAKYLAKAFGSKLVLDYRDEWVDGHRAFVSAGKYDRYWEKRCVNTANSIIFATQGLIDLFKKSHQKQNEEAMLLLSNGWDEDFFKQAKDLVSASEENTNKYVITYIGTLGRFLPVDGFINVLTGVFQKSEKLKGDVFLRFCGNFDDVSLSILLEFQRRFPGNVDIQSRVSKIVSISYYCISDALLLLTDIANNRTFPGKTYEYLASKRPILVYGATGGGDIDKVFSSLGVGHMVPEDNISRLEAALASLNNNRGRQIESKKYDAWLKKHTRKEKAKELFRIFDRLNAV